ncbi:rarD protein [Pseudomonas sp. JV241A]|uniref:rarD protein n=1 Tax=Pseudomonas sp. JV241A TaxID=2078785 RepID=UPI001066DAAC|nr:rarD protein [Pseudomonas sp. JV241A]
MKLLSFSMRLNEVSKKRFPKVRSKLLAVFAGLGANIWLGGSSLYWNAQGQMAPVVLLAYRIFLSLALLLLVLMVVGGLKGLCGKLNKRSITLHASAALLLVVNWGVFIWASVQGYVLETGLGYLIAPCVTVMISVWGLNERLSRQHVMVYLLVGGGVAFLVMCSKELQHGVYLAIAASWGGYVCLKKFSSLDVLSGSALEAGVLASGCLLVVAMALWRLELPSAVFGFPKVSIVFSGFVSVFPLVLLAYAVKHLSLTVMSVFQFVLPITQFILASVVFQQSLSMAVVIVVLAVWGLMIFPLVLSAAKKLF